MLRKDMKDSMWHAICECECLCQKYIKYHLECLGVAEEYKSLAKAHLLHSKYMHTALIKSMETDHWDISVQQSYLAAIWSEDMDAYTKKLAVVEHMYESLH